MRHSGAVKTEPGIVANDDAGAVKTAPGIVANGDAGPVHRPGRIIGCCTICLFASPTWLKASLEDVAVLTFFQGHGLGRLLVENSLWMVRSMVSQKAIEEGLPRDSQQEQQEPQAKQEQHQRFSWKLGACRQKPDIQPKIHVQLTSKPQRKAANALYLSLGFTQKETNVYVLDI
ncbi:MAG: GNAT family N-acetyltransferase [Bacteroidales bacterium]|nr:GNAT family N-acetyltransferase [Candidatus Equibacterium intestinale]